MAAAVQEAMAAQGAMMAETVAGAGGERMTLTGQCVTGETIPCDGGRGALQDC